MTTPNHFATVLALTTFASHGVIARLIRSLLDKQLP